jgi:hypothetical protein
MELVNIPKEVVDALLFARKHFRLISRYIQNPEYDERDNRIGVAIDCSMYAEQIEWVLEEYCIKGELPPIN